MLVVFSLPVQAEPCDEEPCVKPLLQGDEAPWDGQLLSHERAAALVTATDNCSDRVALEMERERRRCTMRLDQCHDDMEAQAKILDDQLERLQRGLEGAPVAREWWEYPVPLWGIAAGVGAGALWGILIAAAAN